MNTKLEKVRQDFKDEGYFAVDVENVQMLGYGRGWDRTPWGQPCDRHEHIGDYTMYRAPF